MFVSLTHSLTHSLIHAGIGYKALKNSLYAGTCWAFLSGLSIIVGSLVITYFQFAIILSVLTLLLLAFNITLGFFTHSLTHLLTHLLTHVLASIQL